MSILENAESVRFNGNSVRSMYADGKKVFEKTESSPPLPSVVLNVEDFRMKNETEEYSDTETLHRAAEAFNQTGGTLMFPQNRVYTVEPVYDAAYTALATNATSPYSPDCVMEFSCEKRGVVDFNGSTIKYDPTAPSRMKYKMVKVSDCVDIELKNGSIIGDRLTHVFSGPFTVTATGDGSKTVFSFAETIPEDKPYFPKPAVTVDGVDGSDNILKWSPVKRELTFKTAPAENSVIEFTFTEPSHEFGFCLFLYNTNLADTVERFGSAADVNAYLAAHGQLSGDGSLVVGDVIKVLDCFGADGIGYYRYVTWKEANGNLGERLDRFCFDPNTGTAVGGGKYVGIPEGKNVAEAGTVRLTDMNISQATGDGIYCMNGSKSNKNNLIFSGLNVHHIRRNGITVGYCDNVYIKDTVITHVGDFDGVKGTSPRSGIDMEAEYGDRSTNKVIMRNITTENCDNYGIVNAGTQINARRENIVIFTDCYFENPALQNAYLTNCTLKYIGTADRSAYAFKKCFVNKTTFLHRFEGSLWIQESVIMNSLLEGLGSGNNRLYTNKTRIENSTIKNYKSENVTKQYYGNSFGGVANYVGSSDGERIEVGGGVYRNVLLRNCNLYVQDSAPSTLNIKDKMLNNLSASKCEDCKALLFQAAADAKNDFAAIPGLSVGVFFGDTVIWQ